MNNNSLSARFAKAQNNLLHRMIHPDAVTAASEKTIGWDPGVLLPGQYCLILSFRADGTAVPTPVWFGVRADHVYLYTAADSGKAQRIRRNPTVRIAPCTFRGLPTGPAMEGTGRVLDHSEEHAAEQAIQANYGRLRPVFERSLGSLTPGVYVEIGQRAP
ncbi:PPOX class F420-dependent oxidoreductase [Rhodococcus oryzae]|uniref:PPOX class F420-dependent oxidoreductase n=1 Tax=Rhodococcus oryzae TaxID=2571143 RepID=UPI0037139C23